MAVAELREGLRLLGKNPVLWLPGIAGGAVCAGLWILYNLTGTFFVGRLFVICALVLFFFIAGMLQVVKNGETGVRSLLSGGIRSFFRVLLPQLVIVFVLILIFMVAMVTLTLAGFSSDESVLSFVFVITAVPVFLLTFFFDTAAVFEDRRVFESVARSVQIVVHRTGEVAVFFLISAGVLVLVVFTMMLLWEAALYDKLQPLTGYNETQIQAFTTDQLIGLVGPTGVWVTAGVIFIGVTLLIPVLYSYKMVFFRAVSGRFISIRQQATTGEYDSKGRWYKY
ncbi:MAG TPA: hypothetical protein VLY83_07145 [Methanoregula sp.]|nr:hypothetical protein [Methanoregula sp.]